MCDNISNTAVCLLCPPGNKPLGHSGCPNGTARASMGQTNTCVSTEQIPRLVQKRASEWKGINKRGGEQVKIDKKRRKRTSGDCCSDVWVLRQKWALTRENETCRVNFLHVRAACEGSGESHALEERAIIFDIAVTFGHCQRAINKGVATLGYSSALAQSLIMNNFPSLVHLALDKDTP